MRVIQTCRAAVTFLVALHPIVVNAQTQPVPFSLNISGLIVEDVAPVLYAQQSGIFLHHGLVVTLEPASSGSAVVAAVASSAYPIGKSSIISAMRAFTKGIPIVGIAPGWIFDSKIPSAEMIVATDGPVRTARDLNDKTVAVSSLNELNQIAASAWIDKNGGDSKTVHYIELPIAASGAAVMAGRVDATVLLEPALSAALATGKVRSLGSAYAAIAPSFPVSVWIASRAWASAHPQIVRAFADSIRESAVYLNSHPEKSMEILSSATGSSLEALRKMVRATAGTSLNETSVRAVVAGAVQSHALPPFDLGGFLWK